MDIELNPPLLGARHTPIRLAGEASLDLDHNGIRLRAASAKSAAPKALMLLVGFLATIFGAGLLAGIANLPSEIAIGVGIAAFGAIFTVATKQKSHPTGEKETHIFPWKNVKKIQYDPPSKCIIVAIKKMKPKGGIYISAGPNSDVERALGKAHRAFLLAEKGSAG